MAVCITAISYKWVQMISTVQVDYNVYILDYNFKIAYSHLMFGLRYVACTLIFRMQIIIATQSDSSCCFIILLSTHLNNTNHYAGILVFY